MDSSICTPEDRALVKQGLGVTEAFASWPPEALDPLIESARVGRYSRGELLYSEAWAEPEILTVVSGHLMSSRLHVDGSRAAIAILGPGWVAGVLRGLNLDDEPFYDYRAHDNAVVIHFPLHVLLNVLDAQAFLWKSMVLVQFRQDRELFTTMVDQLAGSLRRRLAATIARLAKLYGVNTSETATAVSLRLRLSQEELAAMLQASRGAINREMRALEQLGLIRIDHGTTVVGDLPALRELAGAGQ